MLALITSIPRHSISPSPLTAPRRARPSAATLKMNFILTGRYADVCVIKTCSRDRRYESKLCAASIQRALPYLLYPFPSPQLLSHTKPNALPTVPSNSFPCRTKPSVFRPHSPMLTDTQLSTFTTTSFHNSSRHPIASHRVLPIEHLPALRRMAASRLLRRTAGHAGASIFLPN
jgi:hypothetical protein